MRKRSVSVRYLMGAFALGVVGIAIFVGTLMPLEVILVDGLTHTLLGYLEIIPSGARTAPETNFAIRVVAKRSDEFQLVFMIDRPLPQGTKIVKDGTLVGIVSLEGNASSKVEAITSPFFRINGVFASSGIPAEFEGRGSTLLETKVPRGSQVTRGELVLEAEQQNLLLGAVVDIIDVTADTFMTVLVQNHINITTLKDVRAL